MTARQTLFLSWLLAYVYIVIKYSTLALSSKFVNDMLDYMVVSLLYFIPVLLFTTSTWFVWNAARAEKGVWARVIAGMALTWFGYSLVLFLYDFLEPSLSNYFDQLNAGFHTHSSDDYRIEYLVVFVVNLFMYLRLVDKKIQALRGKTSSSTDQSKGST